MGDEAKGSATLSRGPHSIRRLRCRFGAWAPLAYGWLAVVIGSLAFASAAGAQDTTDGVARARALLSVPDAAKLRNQSIPALYRLPKDDRLSAFYRSVWNGDRAAYPELAWASLARPEVRIAFAQFWGQHVRYTTGNKDDIAAARAYVEPFLKDPGHDVRGDAVSFLGPLGSPADIPRLVDICATDVVAVAIIAAHSIHFLARQDAARYLQQCLSRTSNDLVSDAVRSLIKGAK